MAVIEIIAGLLVVTAVVLAIGAVVAGWDRMAAWRYGQTITGRIERKREEIEEHARYMRDLRSRISAPDTPQFRREILNNYLELAAMKRDQLRLELQALEAERDTKEFEERMKRG